MSSYTGHPDDVALEAELELAMFDLCHAKSLNARRAAWQRVKQLHAQRSPREIAAREQHIRDRARV